MSRWLVFILIAGCLLLGAFGQEPTEEAYYSSSGEDDGGDSGGRDWGDAWRSRGNGGRGDTANGRGDNMGDDGGDPLRVLQSIFGGGIEGGIGVLLQGFDKLFGGDVAGGLGDFVQWGLKLAERLQGGGGDGGREDRRRDGEDGMEDWFDNRRQNNMGDRLRDWRADGENDMGDWLGDMRDRVQNFWQSGGRGGMGNAAWKPMCRPGEILAPYSCAGDPCDGAVCGGHAAQDIHCVPDYCDGRCTPVFYNKTGRGERVKCDGGEEGECPVPPYGFQGHCSHNCSSDDDCRAGQKCCFNGCGFQCLRTKFEKDEDLSKCKLVLDDPDAEGNQLLWLFRPTGTGGVLFSTDARGDGSSYARFPGSRQEMAVAIMERADEAQDEIIQTSDNIMWKAEEGKILRGKDEEGEMEWGVVATCNCKACQARGRQNGDGQNQDGDRQNQDGAGDGGWTPGDGMGSGRPNIRPTRPGGGFGQGQMGNQRPSSRPGIRQ